MGFDVSSKADVEGFYCLEHCFAVAADYCYVQDRCWFGDIFDVFSDVELLQFCLRGNGCHGEDVSEWKK